MTSAAPVRQPPIIVAPRKRQFHWAYLFPCLTAVWLCVFFGMEPKPLAAVQQNWPLIVVGLFGSIIANISALGGGIVAIPAMIFWLGYPPMVALKTAPA
jgi:hypothetical protein